MNRLHLIPVGLMTVVLLIVLLFKSTMSIEFFILVRASMLISTGPFSYIFFDEDRPRVGLFFAGLAVLFNPVATLPLGITAWKILSGLSIPAILYACAELVKMEKGDQKETRPRRSY